MMRVSEDCLKKLKELEGLRTKAYYCPGGKLTIGYGHTKGVRPGDRISVWWAKELLKDDVEEVEQQVRGLDVARTEAQLEALTSFAFNLGIARLRSSTLLKVIRQGGSKQAIQREFKRWVYAGGRKLSGLVKRREWEANHFFDLSFPTDEEIINRV